MTEACAITTAQLFSFLVDYALIFAIVLGVIALLKIMFDDPK